MTKQYYKQCQLRRETDDGTKITTGWIEEKYAKIGLRVSFKGKSEIWTIHDIFYRMGKEKVDKQERAYLHQREYSDI